MLTETALRAHERHKQLHASIAEKAAAMRGHGLPAAVKLPPAKLNFEPLPAMSNECDRERLREWVRRQNEVHGSGFFSITAHVTRSEPSTSGRPPGRRIIQAVCDYFGVTILDIESPRRDKSVVRPRQVAVYLCRTMTRLSLPQIGRLLGDRDHSTMIAAIRKIETEIEFDRGLEAQVKELRGILAKQGL